MILIILSLILIIGGIFGFGVWFTRYCDYRQECKHNLFEHDRIGNDLNFIRVDKVSCLVDGKPCYTKQPPRGTEFVGMEVNPNKLPRYGKLLHPWFNKACYETNKK